MRPERSTAAGWWLVPAGLLIGFVGSWCGIGGGLFAVPLLHLGRGLELKRAVASALVLVLATSLASTAAECLRPEPALSAVLVLPLVAGVLCGAPLGFWALQRIPSAALRRVFVVVLLVASWRTLAQHAGDGAGEVAGTPLELVLVAAVGLGGGFVAALIGVGGGLLVVPGLFLLVEGVGFDEARAASLAAAVFAAGRSLALHGRARNVVWGDGLALGAGALVGAGAGVLVLDRFGLIEVGRVLLGVLLAGVAVRFAVEGKGRAAG